jgi:glutamate synthase (NADPH/NADH) large chain
MTGGKVVVLGPTGRNFAAGMSGGVAFLLDADPLKINGEMVDLLSVDDSMAARLRESISRFHAETGSEIASELLADWSGSLNRFTMVMPRDYRRVLNAIARAEREGLDVEMVVMEASNG